MFLHVLLTFIASIYLLGNGLMTIGNFLIMQVVVFLVQVMLGLLSEMVCMAKYRDEYIACTNAVLAESEMMADEVNRWTVHYYVHKDFYFTASKGQARVGYKYSVRNRPSRSDMAGGNFDAGSSFIVS